MLERKRAARGYTAVAGDIDEDRDLEQGTELGDSVSGQESGIVRPTVVEELEHWDENAEDWETTEPDPVVAGGMESLDDGSGGEFGEEERLR